MERGLGYHCVDDNSGSRDACGNDPRSGSIRTRLRLACGSGRSGLRKLGPYCIVHAILYRPFILITTTTPIICWRDIWRC